jgi:hypothetical protein
MAAPAEGIAKVFGLLNLVGQLLDTACHIS